MSPLQTHHHETRRRLGCQVDRVGPTVVYTHRELPWRYFNHAVVLDWTATASAEGAWAAARQMHSLGSPASFEIELFEKSSALHDNAVLAGAIVQAEESAARSEAWRGILKGIGCSECDRLLVMARPIPAAALEPKMEADGSLARGAKEHDLLPPDAAAAFLSISDQRCRIMEMPNRAIDRQVQLHRAGFGAGSGRPASIDRLLVTANIHAGVHYFWAKPPAHPEAVGSVAIMVVDNVAEIFALSVVPAFQRRGIGRQLIERSLQYASGRGCSLAYLQSELNSPAANLYERMGFRPLWQQVCYIL